MIIASPTPSVLPSLVRYLITGISLGLVVAFVYVAATGLFDWQITIRLVNLGMLIGILRWLLACAKLPASGRDEGTTISTKPIHRPRPFVSRLSHFLHCNEDDLRHRRSRFTSRMRFWSRAPLDARHGPKPAWLIRQLLERIRDTVRGNLHS